ncbi:MAG: diguanylate cyclase/phosphodiesterase with and sensor(s) [Ilumatobacteraceae bacterium]|nr:diguanylate cyclase/phosphodiesterase with and sensor(s) [Ilumatobacteraceae bacterium]MCU1387012.1 diguanylate cyclase/phosphodiesterase with and sensor(s) [Ilumatobacteraceae bacterium]
MASVMEETKYAGVAETLDAMPERVIRYRLPDLEITYCNAAWAAGHRAKPSEIIGRVLTDLLSENEQVGMRRQLARLCPELPLIADEAPRQAPNAPGQWVEWVDQYLVGVSGAEILSVGRDVTGRHIAELNLAESEARFRDLADRSVDVVWRFVMDPTPHFDYISPSIETILGYPPAIFLEDFSRFVAILDADGRRFVSRAFAREPIPNRCDLRFRHRDGSILVGEMQATPLRNGLQGVTRDVTELRRLQDHLAVLAQSDPLTGLVNRRRLIELLGEALDRVEGTAQVITIAFLDLDRFKSVNDGFGHDAGDTVLCETARKLLTVAGDGGVVARLGGDEFVIVFEPDVALADRIEQLDGLLRSPIRVGPDDVVVCEASIGFASTTICGRDIRELMAAADHAMYAAKRAKRPAPDRSA